MFFSKRLPVLIGCDNLISLIRKVNSKQDAAIFFFSQADRGIISPSPVVAECNLHTWYRIQNVLKAIEDRFFGDADQLALPSHNPLFNYYNRGMVYD